MSEIKCHHCQHSWTFAPPLARATECPSCRRDVRVCLNCTFYSTTAARGCREEQAEWVKEKDRANFCSYFTPGVQGATRQADCAKAKLDALFAKKNDSPELTSPKGGSLADELARFLNAKR